LELPTTARDAKRGGCPSVPLGLKFGARHRVAPRSDWFAPPDNPRPADR
jgi:hypothetical protein